MTETLRWDEFESDELTDESIRALSARTLRAFVESVPFEGKVLDFGCGKQPYRDIVEACGAEYLGYDSPSLPGSVVEEEVRPYADLDLWAWDEFDYEVILCTQVWQYLEPGFDSYLLAKFHARHAKALVLTYPTTWPEIEQEDMRRFTKAGIEHDLEMQWEVERHEPLGRIDLGGFVLTLNYGLVARAR